MEIKERYKKIIRMKIIDLIRKKRILKSHKKRRKKATEVNEREYDDVRKETE